MYGKLRTSDIDNGRLIARDALKFFEFDTTDPIYMSMRNTILDLFQDNLYVAGSAFLFAGMNIMRTAHDCMDGKDDDIGSEAAVYGLSIGLSFAAIGESCLTAAEMPSHDELD